MTQTTTPTTHTTPEKTGHNNTQKRAASAANHEAGFSRLGTHDTADSGAAQVRLTAERLRDVAIRLLSA